MVWWVDQDARLGAKTIATSAAHPRSVRVIPVAPDIAAAVASLPESFHRDPADRLIVATARVRRLPVLTHDRRITASRLVKKWRPQ